MRMKKFKWGWVILLVFLSGCGFIQYQSMMIFDDGTKTETIILKSNVPAKAKIKEAEIDQRSEAWWEKMMPKNVKIEQ